MLGMDPAIKGAAIELVSITSTASGTFSVAFALVVAMRRGEVAFGSGAVATFSIGGVHSGTRPHKFWRMRCR